MIGMMWVFDVSSREKDCTWSVCACVCVSCSSSGVAVRYVGNSRLPDPLAMARFVVFTQEFSVDFAVESSFRSRVCQTLASLKDDAETVFFLLHRVLMKEDYFSLSCCQCCVCAYFEYRPWASICFR